MLTKKNKTSKVLLIKKNLHLNVKCIFINIFDKPISVIRERTQMDSFNISMTHDN